MWLGAVWRDSAQGRVIKAVKKLPDGVPHNIGCPGEYNYRATFTCDWRQHQFFMDSLVDVLIQLIHETPAGVLVFFPSYAMLRSAQARWRLTDMWGRFERERRKQVFCEADVREARDSQAAFTNLVEGRDGYKAAVDAPGGGGAMLLAVLRGNLSEGVSLDGAYARLVAIIGIPWGPKNDAKLQAKMDFNDQRADDLGSGKKYCERLMCRAVNQALGRAIRSKDDYGAVVLIDERHQNRDASVTGWSPPLWARSFYRCHVEFDGPYQGRDLVGHHGQGFADFVAQNELRPFFAANAAAGPT